MIYEEATLDDIAQMHRVRLSVRENKLGDPSRVTPAHYIQMIETDGKGWVCRADGLIRGVGVADRTRRSIWGLFVEPSYDGRGIGRALHDTAVGWLFENGAGPVWLTTDPGTRAEAFYRRAGWSQTGIEASGELRFELEPARWRRGVAERRA